jgi:hypothetical protein
MVAAHMQYNIFGVFDKCLCLMSEARLITPHRIRKYTFDVPV